MAIKVKLFKLPLTDQDISEINWRVEEINLRIENDVEVKTCLKELRVYRKLLEQDLTYKVNKVVA